MKAIGLHPSSTGKEGGQETGDSVGHYIVPGGPFEVAAHKLLMTGFTIAWTEKPPRRRRGPVEGAGRARQEPKKPKAASASNTPARTWRLNAWAKHRVQLICGGDMTPMEPAPSRTR